MNPYKKHNEMYNKNVRYPRHEWHLQSHKNTRIAYAAIGISLIIMAVGIAFRLWITK